MVPHKHQECTESFIYHRMRHYGDLKLPNSSGNGLREYGKETAYDKYLRAEVKFSLHNLGFVWFEFSATTKGRYINSQVKLYCVPLKVKKNCDFGNI